MTDVWAVEAAMTLATNRSDKPVPTVLMQPDCKSITFGAFATAELPVMIALVQ
jgi:hypothetical protein